MEANKKTTFIKGATILAIAGLICKVIGVLFRVYAGNIVDEPGMDFYEKVYPTYAQRRHGRRGAGWASL